MKIKPEERPTVIGLGVAIAVVLLYGGNRFLNNKKAEPAPTSVTPAAVITPTASSPYGAYPMPAYAQTKSMGGSKIDMYDDRTVEPATTRDPFTPAVPAAELPTDPFRPSSPAFTPRVRTWTRPSTPKVFSPPIQPGLVNPNQNNPNNVPAAAEANSPVNQMILAGVIAGPQAVAVIHVGDRAYPLTAGEKMPFNMLLARITEDGVYVKQGKQTWFIAVGKSLSDAMSMKFGTEGFRAPGSMAPALSSAPIRRMAAADEGKSINTVEAVTAPTRESAAAPSTPTQSAAQAPAATQNPAQTPSANQP